jgi:hypothetical protein
MWMVRLGTLMIFGLCTSVVAGSPTGFVETTILLDAPPVGLAFDEAGALFALEGASFGANTAVLRRILPDGTLNGSFPIVGDDAENFFVGSMTYDPIGDRLLITDNTADGRIYAVDGAGMKQTVATGIAGVAGIAVRSTGEIFVTTSPFGSEGGVYQVDRTTGSASPVLGGLGFGAGLAFEANGNLIVQDADSSTFQGRLQRLPMTHGSGGIVVGVAEPVLAGMQSGAGLVVDSEGDIFTTGSGGLYYVTEEPPTETSFSSNDNEFQFSTAIAFDAGAAPFEAFNGPSGGRLAYMADFGFAHEDSFVTVLTPAQAGDYNGDGGVDANDLALWRETYGSPVDASADGNLDDEVSAADYVIWRKVAPAMSGGAGFSSGNGVPEPTSTAVMGAFMMTGLAWCRRGPRNVRSAGFRPMQAKR